MACTKIARRGFSAASQISYYARLGEIGTARRYFDNLHTKTVESWNSLLSGYFQNMQPDEAKCVFDEMPVRNTVSWNALVSGYMKNGMIRKARSMFDVMPERNVRSWTAMIRGYVEQGMVSEAEALFYQMPEKNVISWTVMLGGLIDEGRIDDAMVLYDTMPVKDVVAKTSMISGLCSKGRLQEAREIFDSMRERNVVCWTSMLSGYTQNGKVDIARKLFEVMPEKNEVSWTAMLMGYTQCGRIEDALELFMAMPTKPIAACKAMVIGLGENGEVSKAREVFDRMRERDEGTWCVMIKVYERKGFELEALHLFRDMQKEGIRPHFPSLISILSVCASLACLDPGTQVHAQMLRSNLDNDVYLSSVLIAMYMRCGEFIKAEIVFTTCPVKDTVMWNTMITGYAQNGRAGEAIVVFHNMSLSGVPLDDVTFIGALTACSYSGKVDEGKAIFESMKSRYQVEPKVEHFACMVDLLGRAGLLDEALCMINTMPIKADAVVWGSLMGACRNHLNPEMAKIAAEQLAELEPHNAGPLVLLSNIYASKGRWGDVAKIRRDMKHLKVNKSPGCSWIEIDKKVHIFTGGEMKQHPEHLEIVRMWEKISAMIREVGYQPDASFALYDVDEEEKMQNLRNHSEKLAVMYGLMKLPEGLPIRVMKNLRICGDCHSAIKLISKVTSREIILRDANRFHHFKDGSCSCKDYW